MMSSTIYDSLEYWCIQKGFAYAEYCDVFGKEFPSRGPVTQHGYKELEDLFENEFYR